MLLELKEQLEILKTTIENKNIITKDLENKDHKDCDEEIIETKEAIKNTHQNDAVLGPVHRR